MKRLSLLFMLLMGMMMPAMANDDTTIVITTSGRLFVCEGDSITLSVPTVPNATYTWKDQSLATWNTVGNARFSVGEISFPSLAIAPDSTLYLAYSDESNWGRATVMKFNGTDWVYVGNPGFSASMILYTSLAIAPDGTLYVAYMDYINYNGATVMKFDGTNWVNVGNPGFSDKDATYVSLAIAPDGTLYVAYRDYGNSLKATVMKFNDTSWVNVGNAGFSAGQAEYTSLAIAPDGTPYIAYSDYTNSSKAIVMKFNGTSWITVGNAGFSTGLAYYTFLAIAPNGTPFIAFRDGGNNNSVTVMKFNGTSWVNVGNTGFSAGQADNTSLAIAPDGTPFIAFRDGSNDKSATVMKFNGTSWVNVGYAGFSNGEISYPSIAVTADGTPYIAYSEHTSTFSGKATVKKFEIPTVGKNSPKYVTTVDGCYSVTLTTDNGNSYNSQNQVCTYILTKPKAGFAVNNTTQCLTNNRFEFTDTSSIVWGTTYTRLWKFGKTDTSSTAIQTFDSAGVYPVSLIIKSSYGCNDSATINITVNPIDSSSSIQTVCDSYTFNGNVYTSSGVYRDTLKNIDGCDSIIITQLTVNPKPVTSAISGNANPEINSIYNYSVIHTTGSIYNWFVTNGVQISGDSTSNITVQWGNLTGESSIKVVETNPYNCSGDTVSQITHLFSSVEQIGRTGKSAYTRTLSVHPNPFNDKITLLINSPITESGILQITDINGRLIIEQNIPLKKGKTTIDLSNQTTIAEPGVYFLHVTTDNATSVQRIVKVR